MGVMFMLIYYQCGQLPRVEPHVDATAAALSESPLDQCVFRTDVEGLRGLAVILVVLYHAEVPWLAGGFIGVDVFFTISGMRDLIRCQSIKLMDCFYCFLSVVLL